MLLSDVCQALNVSSSLPVLLTFEQYHHPCAFSPKSLLSSPSTTPHYIPQALGLVMITPTLVTVRLDNIIKDAPHAPSSQGVSEERSASYHPLTLSHLWLEFEIENNQLHLVDHRSDQAVWESIRQQNLSQLWQDVAQQIKWFNSRQEDLLARGPAV